MYTQKEIVKVFEDPLMLFQGFKWCELIYSSGQCQGCHVLLPPKLGIEDRESEKSFPNTETQSGS